MNQSPEVLFENIDLLVIDKPAGLSIHDHRNENTVLTYYKYQLFPVHRLDKETSGVQILAKSAKAAQSWASEFESRNVEKYYLGVLRGQLAENEGVWNEPLTDAAEGRAHPAGPKGDQIPCETRFKLQSKNKFFSCVDFRLITGRQHQIRKHAALAGHHLIGDTRYGEPSYNRKISEIYDLGRMMLHCQKIEIKNYKFMAKAPKEFAQLMPEL